MGERKVYRAIGLMSGTSLDGIDAALIETDGREFVKPIAFKTVLYDDRLREMIRGCLGITDRTSPRVLEAEHQMTLAHIALVKQFDLSGVEVIGLHGQTIHHAPEKGVTVQIGDAGMMARATGIHVVADFRRADVEAGGQGAPLLPLYHQARVIAQDLPRPVAILNIGGVANVTWIGRRESDILAFDTGPGNALIDDWMRLKTGKAYDEGGRLAHNGHFHEEDLDHWFSHPYFDKKPPKSLDRNQWNIAELERLRPTPADGAAILTFFTAQTVADAVYHFPRRFGFIQRPKRWYVSGGGRKNKTLMDWLQARLQRPVRPVEDLGWNGDALEAEGFAYLAVRHLVGEPVSVPGTTGVPKPQTGGVLFRAKP
jgi:anhydro-N-acetylmuramic acid kinase